MSVTQSLTVTPIPTPTTGSVHLQLSNNDSGDQGAAMANIVPKSDRHRYGFGFEILASSNRFSEACIPSPARAFWERRDKNIFTVANPEFATFYEEKINDTTVSAICELLPSPNHRWVLNVFRMGYESEKLQNPIVIHLVVYDIDVDTVSGSSSKITDTEASSIVDAIKAALVNSKWEGEEIRVDVCRSPQLSLRPGNRPNREDGVDDPTQPYPSMLAGNAPNHEDGVDLLDSTIDLYTFKAPLPGSSLGPQALPSAGTLTGYIKHVSGKEVQIFALTCHHVVIDTNLAFSSCLDKDGETEHLITSPASTDHLSTKNAISDKIKTYQRGITLYADRLAKNPTRTRETAGFKLNLESSIAMKDLWEMIELEAASYDINFGYVYATSGRDSSISCRDWKGVLDWALISGPAHKQTQNRHVPWNVYDRGSGFAYNRPVRGLDAESIKQARKYFHNGPNFKPLQERTLAEEELVFKPVSRTTGWVVGELNGIMSVWNFETGITREWSIVASNAGDSSFAPGDSGAVILDKNFHPIAMLWGIFNNSGGFARMAFVTPIVEILRGIERRLGWEVGSASLY